MAERSNPDPCDNSVSSASAGDCYLENTRAERHVWLMKCPPVVARAMQSQYLHPPLPFSLDPSATTGKSIAKVAIAVDPLLPSDEFSSTQVIDDDSGLRMRSMPGIFDVKSSGSVDRKKVSAKASETKRTRRDPEEMEKIMFKLFEKQPNWTLKQLIQETDQPEQFLKDMLKVLCIYNNKGANQGTYELKAEYQRSEYKSDTQ